jgi:transcriptional regulator with XRE-family HTH domain
MQNPMSTKNVHQKGIVMSRTKNVTFLAMETGTDPWKAFGKWLQDEREKTNVTQEMVHKETGLNVKSISRIERGEGGTKKTTIIMIVNAINKLSPGYKINLDKALGKAGFAPLSSTLQKPTTVAEFIERLNEMGFAIQFDADLTKLTPDDLQDLIDSIEANLLVKTKKL